MKNAATTTRELSWGLSLGNEVKAMATIIAQFKKWVKRRGKKKAPFLSEEVVVLWSQKQMRCPHQKKKKEEERKKKGGEKRRERECRRSLLWSVE